MDYRNWSALAATEDDATLFVALELSEASWLVALQVTLEGKMSVHTLRPGDVAGVVRLVEGVRERVARRGRGLRVLACYEAGRDAFWLQRMLAERGIPTLVLDAASIAVPRRGRRRKTDRLDVRQLLWALMRLVRGEAEVRVARPPTRAEEDARRPCRERERLVQERVGHVNRIKALCAQQGIKDYAPLRRDRRERLAALRTAEGGPLPPNLAAEIGRELARLELVLAQLAELEAARDAVLAAPPPPDDPAAARIHALVRLKSIGAELATRLTREVYYRAFDNRRQLGAFVGLDGSPWRSGGIAREQGISKAGNRRARAAAIELAWLWLRYQPDSALSRWFRARVAGASGAAKRSKIVALARKLVVALWRYLTTGLVPEGAVLKPAA